MALAHQTCIYFSFSDSFEVAWRVLGHVANVRSKVVRCEAIEVASALILCCCVSDVYTLCSFKIYGVRAASARALAEGIEPLITARVKTEGLSGIIWPRTTVRL